MSRIASTCERLLREERGLTRLWTSLAIAICLSGGAVVYHQGLPDIVGGGGADLFLATTGSNSNDCSSGSPCLTMDHARDIAACGDTVEMAAGTYGSQSMSSPTNSCTSDPVIFTNNGSVTLGNTTMNSPGTTLDGLNGSATAHVDMNENCVTCALLNSAWRSFNVWGADYVTIAGNTFDGDDTIGRNYVQDSDPQDSNSPIEGITIYNNTLQNYCCDGSHEESMYIGGEVYDLLIDGNSFPHNTTTADGTAHFFFTWCGHAQGEVIGCASPSLNTYPDRVCVRNNTFGDGPPFYAIQARPEIPDTNDIKVVSTQTSGTPSGLLGPSYSEWMLVSSCSPPSGAPPIP